MSVPPTAMKGATSCFQRVWVVPGSFEELQPGLLLDDMEDLINREIQGVKVMEPLAFAVVGRASSLGVGTQCSLTRFLELSG